MTTAAVCQPPSGQPEPSRRVLRRWLLLASLSLSAAYLSLSSSQMSPWDSPTWLSPAIAEGLRISQSSISFPKSTRPLPGFSPRIPSILFPLVEGARLLMPVFRQRWLLFSRSLRERGINAVEAVQMARFGFVPQFSSPPVQLAPPLEPQWSTEVLPRIQEIHAALLQSSTVEEVAPPDYDAAQVHLAAAAAMCYYGGTPFLVPSVVMPFVHIMFAVPKPHSDKWRGVSGLRRFNSWIIPQLYFCFPGF